MSSSVNSGQLQSTQFSLDLLQLLHKGGSNLVLSPYSLVSALVMLLPGTDGESKAQIVKSLFNSNDSKGEDANKHVKLFAASNKDNLLKNKDTLKVANLLYSHKDFTFKPEYVSILTKELNSTGKELDFCGQKAQALNIINTDVSNATNGLIDKLLEKIDDGTVLILVNAIYFKGLWEKPFSKDETNKAGEFRTSSGAVIKTPLMFKRKKFPYFFDEHSKTKAVQLNYQKEGNIAMVLILPGEGMPVSSFLKGELSAEKLHHILEHLSVRPQVNLTLPRFKLSATHQLIEPLKKLGVTDVFDPLKANLGHISSSGPLVVSEVIQKAVIAVDEEGTEAAAATSVRVMYCMAALPPRDEEVAFTADRPFIFALVTQDTPKQVLFIGVVEDPSK